MNVIYDGVDHHLKVFDNAAQTFICEAHNDSVAENAWRPDAGCPPGTYTLGSPEANTTEEDQRSMGPWFVPLYGIPDHDGIGIHGGGSCVAPHSMDPYQGWCPTENCIRVQNADLLQFVDVVKDHTPLVIKVVQSA